MMAGTELTAFQAALAEVEAVTAQLLASDPQEFDSLRGLLERRRVSVNGVIGQLGMASAAADGALLVDRLHRACQQGREFEERLMLVRADTRARLQDLYRLHFHIRALAPEATGAAELSSFPSSHRLDVTT